MFVCLFYNLYLPEEDPSGLKCCISLFDFYVSSVHLKFVLVYSRYVMYFMNNHIYSTLFKTQERESNRRSKEIEQRKESQNTHTQTKQQGHVTLSTEL